MNLKNKISKSLNLQEKAKKIIPGLSQLLSKRPDMFSYGVWPGYFERAKGVEVWDLDGNKYIDMSIGGIGANVLGYCDPDVDNAVISCIKKGTSSSLNCPEDVELAEKMVTLHPWAEKARFSRSGGEAMTIAVRIARAYTGRDTVLFCGYHGWHDWYLATNLEDESNLNQHLIAGLSPVGVPKGLKGTAIPFRYNQIHELEELIKKHGQQVAAIVMEPIRNHEPTDNFLQNVRSIADRNKSVLIIDEISSGFRLCAGGAHLKYDLRPDIAVFSKALGNGYPISAIIGKGSIMDAAQSSFISSTNWTERVGPTAALAMIQKFENHKVHEHLIEIGNMVQKGWNDLAKKHGISVDVGGIPPLSHFSINEKNSLGLKALFIQSMLEEGFLASTNFYPMYAHTKSHAQDYLAACDKAFAKLADNLNNPDIKSLLEGDPAKSGFARLT